MMISPFPFMSISSFCEKVGAGLGNSVISGGEWEGGRRKVLIGHLKQALYEKVPTVALIQQEDPDLDATLYDYARYVCNTNIRIVNGTSSNYRVFDEWAPAMFGSLAAEMLPGDVKGFAQSLFRLAYQAGLSFQSLHAAIEGLNNCPPNISTALSHLILDLEEAFQSRIAVPGRPSFNIGSEQGKPTLCVIHLDAFCSKNNTWKNPDLVCAYFAQELHRSQQKLWIADLATLDQLTDVLKDRMMIGMLGICGREATAQMFKMGALLPGHIVGVNDINSAAILFAEHISPSVPDLQLLHINEADIGLFTKVVYYHGRRSFLNGGQPMIRPSVYLE